MVFLSYRSRSEGLACMLLGTDLGHAVMIGDFDPVAREHSHNKVPVFKVRHARIVAQVCMYTHARKADSYGSPIDWRPRDCDRHTCPKEEFRVVSLAFT